MFQYHGKMKYGNQPTACPPTIVFTQKTGASFTVLITPTRPAKKDTPKKTAEQIRELVRQAAESVKLQAVEETIDLFEFKGTSGLGYNFFATDRAPKQGEHRYITQGMLGVGELLLTFTILTNEGQQAIVTQALSMLTTSKRPADTVSFEQTTIQIPCSI